MLRRRVRVARRRAVKERQACNLLLGVSHEVAEGSVALPHASVEAAEAKRLTGYVERGAVVATAWLLLAAKMGKRGKRQVGGGREREGGGGGE